MKIETNVKNDKSLAEDRPDFPFLARDREDGEVVLVAGYDKDDDMMGISLTGENKGSRRWIFQSSLSRWFPCGDTITATFSND